MSFGVASDRTVSRSAVSASLRTSGGLGGPGGKYPSGSLSKGSQFTSLGITSSTGRTATSVVAVATVASTSSCGGSGPKPDTGG